MSIIQANFQPGSLSGVSPIRNRDVRDVRAAYGGPTYGGPTLPNLAINFIFAAMNVLEIEHEAMALPDSERGVLAAKLLDSLAAAEVFVSNEDVTQRENDLATGKVSGISHAGFFRRVQRERGQ
jgi:hypothetical protein